MLHNYLYAIFELFNHCFDQSTLKFSFQRNLDTLYIASHRKGRTLILSTISCDICIDSMLCISTGEILGQTPPNLLKIDADKTENFSIVDWLAKYMAGVRFLTTALSRGREVF